MKIADRWRKLRQRLAEKEIDAICITQPENRYYLSGFDGSFGFLLITPQKVVLATDFRYVEQVKRQAPDCDILPISGNVVDWFPGLVTDLRLKRLGFEAGHVTFAAYQQLTEALKESRIKLISVDGMVESLRVIKEPGEIELIIKAAEITDKAFEYIEDIIRIGMREEAVAWEIEKFLRQGGSQTIPFDIIVASGPNSALPHARPSSRSIQAGEPVMIDIGARVGGYSSDLSRTICLGSPDDIFNKVCDIVLGAQLAALAIIKQGMTGDEVDRLARTVIEQAGYGEAFGHGLGHGIGLASHEQPRLCPEALEPLVDGMVFTIEPGIYLTGWGGVRIEDVVVMGEGKTQVISKARKVIV